MPDELDELVDKIEQLYEGYQDTEDPDWMWGYRQVRSRKEELKNLLNERS